MNKIKLVSDGSCDFSESEIAFYNIDVVPFSVSFDGTTYLKEGVDITLEEFHKKLTEPDAYAKTSLPSLNDYIEVFTKAVENGQDVLCVTISSKFSGSYQGAINAKNIVLEDYENANIIIIDSLTSTGAQGNLIKYAHRLIENGKTIQEVEQILNNNRLNTEIYFTVGTLKYLQKGGRIGKGAALVGELLNVNPILALKDGELIPISKVRGRKKALQSIFDNAISFIGDREVTYANVLTVSHIEDAEIVISKCNEASIDNVTLGTIGVTVTAHSGANIVGIVVSCFTE